MRNFGGVCTKRKSKGNCGYIAVVRFCRVLVALIMSVSIEVVSQPRITLEGKAQTDSKAHQPRQYVSISRGLQRRYRASDGVMKPLLTLPGSVAGLFEVAGSLREG